MILLHQFEIELKAKEEIILDKERQIKNIEGHMKEKEQSSQNIIYLLRKRMQSDIDKLEETIIRN